MKYINTKRLRVSLSLFFILLFFFNITHFVLSNQKKSLKKEFTDITKLPGIVRSVNFFEHRFFEYKDYSTTYNYDIKEIDSLGIVYE